ncbi:MAG: hypothetical protein K2H74_05425, partial [Paramuribaculum sp.]|nr:hypothetical protein [Paramuribaculum sp.]
TARIRVIYQNAWISLLSPNAKNITEVVAYDISVNVLDHDPDVHYLTPGGTMHSSGQAYVKQIYTTDALSDIDFSWNASPESVYTCVDNELQIEPGSTFTLHLVANDLGNTSIVRQDLRYNIAYIYTDFDGDGQFTLDRSYGSSFSGANTPANYSIVMNIDHPFSVPENIDTRFGRIRVIYHNAWKTLSDPNTKDIYEGQAIDIPLEVVSGLAGVDNITTDDTSRDGYIYDILGRRVIGTPAPGFYIINGQKVFIQY